MNHRALAALLASFPILASAQGARMDAVDGIPKIVVTAVRSVRVLPDAALFFVAIEGTAEAPADAAQRAERKVKTVMDTLRALGPRVEASAAVPYGVSPATTMTSFPGNAPPTQYVARYVVRVRTTRLDQFMRAAASVMDAGASAVSSPTFDYAASDSVRRVRFGEAVAQARHDAESLAAASGGKLGAIIDVTSSVTPGAFSGPFTLFSRMDFTGITQPPDVTIGSTVTVRFRLEPR
jgi:uncharacterized protein YggE